MKQTYSEFEHYSFFISRNELEGLLRPTLTVQKKSDENLFFLARNVGISTLMYVDGFTRSILFHSSDGWEIVTLHF